MQSRLTSLVLNQGILPQNADNAFKIYLVPRTDTPDSEENGKIIAQHAISLATIDTENEQFIRDHHPTLSSRDRVWVSKSVFGPPVWLIDVPLCPSEFISAGGRPIHYHPADHMNYYPTGSIFRCSDAYEKGFTDYINPRRVLEPDAVSRLQMAFEHSVGVEILVAGFMVVLYDREKHVRRAYQSIWPLEFAGLRVLFDVDRRPNGQNHGSLGWIRWQSTKTQLIQLGWSLFDRVRWLLRMPPAIGIDDDSTSQEKEGCSADDRTWAHDSGHNPCSKHRSVNNSVLLGTGYVWGKEEVMSTYLLWHTGAEEPAFDTSASPKALLSLRGLIHQGFKRECFINGDDGLATQKKYVTVNAGFVALE